MNIIELAEKLENIVVKNDLVDISSTLKQEYAISKSEELKKTIQDMEDENRILRLGILGRVKAGKSSLLNALIFDGQDVLPKAATPMTAALTILQYGEETRADVEFFTQEDIDDLEQDVKRYERNRENIKCKEYEKLKKGKLKKEGVDRLSPEQEQEIEEKALKIAQRELKKDDNLSSAYDQYQKIKSSGVSLDELKQYGSIVANSVDELNKQLLDFVGANGKYMPFTKSVTMTIPQESLKDIQIIDTPGVNDPIVSREERTRALLKDCDVVLIVSPSGQFLSSEDLELMDRITTKEGIKELYLVASQVDNQLYGSEKDSGGGILSNVLAGIEDKLTTQQRSVLERYKNDNPEIGTTFDSLIKHRVVASSGICYSMFKNFDTQNNWDSNMKHVWKLLNEYYKDFFTDADTSIANLKKLANIETIRDIIKDVRGQKDAILAKRKDDFIKAKYESLLKYKEALIQDTKDQIQRVQSTDINELKQQQEELEKFKSKAVDTTNEAYLDLVEQLKFGIKRKLHDDLESYFEDSANILINSEGTDTKWFGMVTFKTVKAGVVWTSLKKLTDKLEFLISTEVEEYISTWQKKILKVLVNTLRNVAGDNNLDATMISKTIRSILMSIIFPKISYNRDFPKSLKKSETLKESEAEEFIQESYLYIDNLEQRVKKDINSYINLLIDTLKQKNIGEDIFAKYTKKLESLANDIENKELSLARLNYILKQLECV